MDDLSESNVQSLDSSEIYQIIDELHHQQTNNPSLKSINKINTLSWQKGSAFIGPGALVAVGYIDPGNWATDLAGGSYGGYAILCIVLISNLVAMLLQIMSARLGIATGKDLAEISRETWPRAAWPAWIATELTIIATDLAEVLGSAIALQLLFDIPLAIGVVLTAFDVLLILAFDRRGSHMLERLIILFLSIIAIGLMYELILASPILGDVLKGFIPTSHLVLDPKLLYLSIGVIGATVMPHNLYLHSNLVLHRWRGIDKHKTATIATVDTIISLSFAMLLNSALVILAASVFHYSGRLDVAEISDAHHLLNGLLSNHNAAIVFAIILLIAGQSATITGTLAGQVVMTGFVQLRMKLWIRRLITRLMALVPALIVIIYYGEQCITNLIVSSQVFLSLQLPFAMLTLLTLTSDPNRMGSLVNKRWMNECGWIFAFMIILANIALIINIILPSILIK